jgi:hypothetical protein
MTSSEAGAARTPRPSQKAPWARSHVGSPAREGRVPLFAEERVQRVLVAMAHLALGRDAPPPGHRTRRVRRLLPSPRQGEPGDDHGVLGRSHARPSSGLPEPREPAGSSQERVGRVGRQGPCAVYLRVSVRRSASLAEPGFPLAMPMATGARRVRGTRGRARGERTSKTDSIGAPARETACRRSKREGSAQRDARTLRRRGSHLRVRALTSG